MKKPKAITEKSKTQNPRCDNPFNSAVRHKFIDYKDVVFFMYTPNSDSLDRADSITQQ